MFNNIDQIKQTLSYEIIQLQKFLQYVNTNNEYYVTELEIRKILLEEINKEGKTL